MAASHSFRAADPFAPRNLWLAGLGLAAVARRETGNAVRAAVTTGCRLRGDAVALAGDVRDIARGGMLTLRERIEPALAACGAQAQAQWAPLLAGLEDMVAGRHVVRTPQSTRKTPARKAAARKRTTGRAARTPRR